jgi:predicted trehalose synthase
MEEQLTAQLTAQLKERVGLTDDQAQQAVAVTVEFMQQNMPALLQLAQEKSGINIGGLLGGLLGGR